MKFTAAYYLLLIYVTVVIKPLIPLITDEWDHQFNEIEHISIVHAKYGSNHLQKELAGAASDSNNKSQNTLKTEDLVPFHIATPECKYHFVINKLTHQYHHFEANSLPLISIISQGQPPEFS